VTRNFELTMRCLMAVEGLGHQGTKYRKSTGFGPVKCLVHLQEQLSEELTTQCLDVTAQVVGLARCLGHLGRMSGKEQGRGLEEAKMNE
jgi:hypothetical protein